MFIDVTRLGGGNVRLAPIAIAYLVDYGSGCHIHLSSGDYLRVEEGRVEVELRASSCGADGTAPFEPAVDPVREMVAADIGEAAGVLSPAEAMEIRIDATSRRRGRGR